jgi:hypothetical protein
MLQRIRQAGLQARFDNATQSRSPRETVRCCKCLACDKTVAASTPSPSSVIAAAFLYIRVEATMLSFLKFFSPLELQVRNSSWKFNFQGRLGTWAADRTKTIPNEHAGRLDPPASHRPRAGAAGWEYPLRAPTSATCAPI